MGNKERKSSLSQFKKPSSQMTSEDLQKIFEESEICRSHFFPKEVPSLSIKEAPLENASISSRQEKKFKPQDDFNIK